MASKNQALPDGSFPIRDATDLANAIKSVGRAKSYAKARAHIIKRARQLGRVDMLPASWGIERHQPSLAEMEFEVAAAEVRSRSWQ